VLDLAAVIRIGEEFSPAEQGRARAAAARDRRLAAALAAEGYGLTQTLAAAPQLVARWQDAQAADPYGAAVLTAALDVSRLGGRAPLSADLLQEAAPGYCTSQQQAEAPGNWFEQALAYATAKLHGAAAALTPAAGAGMGQVTGYTVADYLLQHASQERRTARVPAGAWDALLRHICDPTDAARLADSARGRLLYRYAIPLYHRAADAGDWDAAWWLANMLARRGDLDQVQQPLRARADAGDWDAAHQLAGMLLARHKDRGDLDQVKQLLRAGADAGHGDSAKRLDMLLAQLGDLDGLRARADAGDEYAADLLVGPLGDHRDPDQAEQLLRARADAGDGGAAFDLAYMLAVREDLDELRARADAGDGAAAGQLAGVLAERGDLDELRARADAGDGAAASQLAGVLAQRGDLDGLRARADAGDGYAAMQLADVLADRGDLDQAEQIWRAHPDAGHGAAARQLADLLARRGDLDEAAQILRAGADAGDPFAAGQLVKLLAERGDADGLRARADAGDGRAAWRLVEVLADRGDLDQAEQLLRARADAGHGDAWRLADLLEQRGQGEEAERLRRFGLNPDGSIARG